MANQDKLTQKVCDMAAGCAVDIEAMEAWGVDDLHVLRRLSEQYHMGWLHNVLARITPLTLDRIDDYLVMADLFVSDKEEAEHILDRFDSDLELFCSVAGIQITKHMTSQNISEELKSHVELYIEVEKIFASKFRFIDLRDPIAQLTSATMSQEHSNEFIKNFMDTRFKRSAN